MTTDVSLAELFFKRKLTTKHLSLLKLEVRVMSYCNK